MAVLIVAVVNVLFIIFVYSVFSRRVRELENRRLPEEMRQEIDALLTTFNRTADTNISLLDDRVARLTPLQARSEKAVTELEGLIRRAEALRSELRQPAPKSAEPVIPANTARSTLPFDRKRAVESYASEKPDPAPARKKPARKTVRKKKKQEDSIADLAASGLSVPDIARKLALSEQQVEMRLAFLRSRDTGSGQSG